MTVDSQPAGVAPVYPWIYSGGIDPFLWVPIPGVETLNFAPYRVNLTPFAGSFDDGNPHTIAVSVFNDNNYFAANGALLIYVDHHATQLTGKVVSDGTPASPAVKIDRDVTFGSSGAAGSIKTTATHPVSLYGLRRHVARSRLHASHSEHHVLEPSADRRYLEHVPSEHQATDDDHVRHVDIRPRGPQGTHPDAISARPSLLLPSG